MLPRAFVSGRTLPASKATRSRPSALDDTAGDACAGIARRVSDLIVFLRVHDDRRAVGVEQSSRRAGGERYRGSCDEIDVGLAGGVRHDVRHVTRVRTGRIVQTVLRTPWIQVRAGGSEAGRVALPCL